MEAVTSDDGDLFAVMTIHDETGESIQYAFREEGARAIIQAVESWLSLRNKN